MDPLVIFEIGLAFGFLALVAFIVLIVFLIQWMRSKHSGRAKIEGRKTWTAFVIWMLLLLISGSFALNGLNGVINDNSKLYYRKHTIIRENNSIIDELDSASSKLANDLFSGALNEMSIQRNSSNSVFREYINNHQSEMDNVLKTLDSVQSKLNRLTSSKDYKKYSDKKIRNASETIQSVKDKTSDIYNYVENTTDDYEKLSATHQTDINELNDLFDKLNSATSKLNK